jgi:polyisoprenoid-binding protein YceI
VLGYRVHENLHGQDNEAAGRTNEVTGSMAVSGATISSLDLTVAMGKVSSDDNRRDQQFRGRIMNVSKFPNATFKLSAPITLPSVPTDSSMITVAATGDLTVHGTTRSVTVTLHAQRDGANLKVQGNIPVTFSDYGIASPSFADITVDPSGEIELLVVLTRG